MKKGDTFPLRGWKGIPDICLCDVNLRALLPSNHCRSQDALLEPNCRSNRSNFGFRYIFTHKTLRSDDYDWTVPDNHLDWVFKKLCHDHIFDTKYAYVALCARKINCFTTGDLIQLNLGMTTPIAPIKDLLTSTCWVSQKRNIGWCLSCKSRKKELSKMKLEFWDRC